MTDSDSTLKQRLRSRSVWETVSLFLEASATYFVFEPSYFRFRQIKVDLYSDTYTVFHLCQQLATPYPRFYMLNSTEHEIYLSRKRLK